MKKAGILFLSICWVGCLFGQGINRNFEELEGIAKQEVAARKYPSLLKSPDKQTPADQLAWAQDLLEKGQKKAARKQFRNLVHEWHASKEAPQAQLIYATLLDEAGKYELAFKEYQYLMDYFAGSFSHGDVLDRQYRIANYVKNKRRFGLGIFKGFASPERALPMYESIVKNGRNWKNAPEAQFQRAKIFEDAGQYDEAVTAYDSVRINYPQSELAMQASYRRAFCLYRIARKFRYDERSCRDALSALAMFRRDYPESDDAEHVGKLLLKLKDDLSEKYYRIAVYYDVKAKKPKAALIAYTNYIRQFPSSAMVKEAEKRVEALKVQLELEEYEE